MTQPQRTKPSDPSDREKRLREKLKHDLEEEGRLFDELVERNEGLKDGKRREEKKRDTPNR